MSKNYAGFMKRVLLVMLAGIFSTTAMPLDIYQGPLVEDRSMDPNMVYLHDNSGSMSYTYMPEEASDSNLGKANFYNRQYYNPDITYVPPLKYEAAKDGNPPKLVSWGNMDQRCVWPRVMNYGMSGLPGKCELSAADVKQAAIDRNAAIQAAIDDFNSSLTEHYRTTLDANDFGGTIYEARKAYEEVCGTKGRSWQRTAMGAGTGATMVLNAIGNGAISGTNTGGTTAVSGSGSTGGTAKTDTHTSASNCLARNSGLITNEEWQEAYNTYMEAVNGPARERDETIAQVKAEYDIVTNANGNGYATLTGSTAVYYDYVPGFNSRIDNKAGYTWEPIRMVNGLPVMDNPANAPEKVDGNYEKYAFSAIPSGNQALFREGGDGKVSRSQAINRDRVRNRACPILFRDASDSRAYYSDPVSPAAPGADFVGNPHAHCRYSYRTGDVDFPSNYQGFTSSSPFAGGTAGRVGGLDAGVGRPWCNRTTRLNNITSPNVDRTCYQGKHVIGDTDGTGRWTAGKGATSSESDKTKEVSRYNWPGRTITDLDRNAMRIAANLEYNDGLYNYVHNVVPQARVTYDEFCQNDKWTDSHPVFLRFPHTNNYIKVPSIANPPSNTNINQAEANKQLYYRKKWQHYFPLAGAASPFAAEQVLPSPANNSPASARGVSIADAGTTPVVVEGDGTVIGDHYVFDGRTINWGTGSAAAYHGGRNQRPIWTNPASINPLTGTMDPAVAAAYWPAPEAEVTDNPFDHDYDLMYTLDESWKARWDQHVGKPPAKTGGNPNCNVVSDSLPGSPSTTLACVPTTDDGEDGSQNCYAYAIAGEVTLEEWRDARNAYYAAVNSLTSDLVQAYLNAKYLASSVDQSLEHRVSKFVDNDGNLYEIPVARARTAAEEIRNFANWYSYYRTRSLAAKTGITLAFANLLNKDNTYEPGKILHGKSIRLGYDVLNGIGGDGPGQRSGDIAKIGRGVVPFLDFPSDAKTADGDDHPYKGETFVRDFYNWVASITVSGGTPLRRKLSYIGEYYKTAAPWLEYPPTAYATGNRNLSATSKNQEFACRRSFTILMTDGYWNGDSASTSGARANVDAAVNGPDIYRTDKDNNNLTSDPKDHYKYIPAPPFNGENTGIGFGTYRVDNSLADVAMYYWNRDLRDKTPNLVAPTKKNPAFWQHMQTFTLGLGVVGRMSDKEVNRFLATGTNKKVLWTFPTGLDTQYERIDDLMHAGLNGHGGTAAAEDAGEFADKLTALLTEISGVDGTFTTPAVQRALTKDAQIYEASYSPTDWTGELLAYGTCIKGESGCDSNSGFIQLPALWSASEKLRDIKHGDRKIFTMVDGAATEFKSVNLNRSAIDVNLKHLGLEWGKCPFAWDGVHEHCKLGGTLGYTDKDGATTDAGFTALINYLRGDQQYEDTATGWGASAAIFNGFRSRSHRDANNQKYAKLLGDIVNSSPVLVTPRRDGWNKSPVLGYAVDADDKDVSTGAAASYAQRLKDSFTVDPTTKQITINTDNRELAVLVGAGDGMLHGFDARPLNDNSTDSDKEAAGKELFAFIPSAVHGILKKLADPQYGQTNDLSYSFYVDGVTVIGEIPTDSGWRSVAVGSTGRSDAIDSDKRPASSYFALDVERPSGFGTSNVLWEVRNPDLGTPANGQASIALMCRYNEKNECPAGNAGFYAIFGNGYSTTDDSWRSALFTVQMDTGATSISHTGEKGGLSRPALVGYNNGTSVLAYAGDLQGNLWKFDLRTDPPTVVGKLLVATDPDGKPQPITGAPRVVIDGNAIQVVVATGKYLDQKDVDDKSVQTIYSVRDACGLADSCSLSTAKRDGSGGGALTEVTVSTGKEGGWSLEKFAAPLDYSGVQGFFIDLNAPGMTGLRGIAKTTPELRAGTNQIAIPLLMPSVNPCAAAVEGVIMEVDAMNGAPKKNLLFASLEDAAYREGNGLDIAIGYSIDGAPLNFGANDAEIGGSNDPVDCLGGAKAPGGGIIASGGIISCGSKQGRQSWRQIR
ncbi:MAG: hypothetical protein LBU53_12910 [Zoogloeaceae bacterium]|jgi:type IV pilus assembly protein PilY1|nr:hypothetical protein [Zoogloeaceae bacterium]